MNKVLFSIYRFFKLFYTSFYYYFMPFVATFVVWLVLVRVTFNVAEDYAKENPYVPN